MSKMQRKLTLELGYEPSVTELADALEMSEDKVMEIMQIAREPASLETPIGEEDDSNLGDFVADSNVVTPEGNVENVMLREHIDSLLKDLKERERQVIELRFGLKDGHPRTLEEVGKEFNVTRERIRQIEQRPSESCVIRCGANASVISCKWRYYEPQKLSARAGSSHKRK